MATRSQPNILWICTDQQRWDTTGCAGNPFVTTPHLDALAGEGVRFEHAYTQNPVCTPSRASFLTGRYPRTTRCRQNGQMIPAEEVLVTRLLADAGYTCGLSGKLHLAPCHPSVCKSSEQRIDDGYAEFHWSHDPGDDWPCNEYIQWLREKGVEQQTRPCALSQYVTYGMPEDHHHTTWCAQKAITFIEENARFEQPWLFSVNIFDPHHAFDPPEEYLAPYLEKLDEIPLPNYEEGELENKPCLQSVDHRGAYNTPGLYPYPEMNETDHRVIRAAYWAMVDLIDKQVGRMIAALERTGQRENTLIVFMSDHGEMLGDHGIYLKGPHFYEGAVRVPLMLSWPGHITQRDDTASMVELVDVAPTLLEAAGLEVYKGMQGKSLWPLLAGEMPAEPWRNDVYAEYYNSNYRHKPPAYGTMLRTATHKLTVMHGTGQGELYDLRTDPLERHNLWADPEAQSVKLELMQRLCDRMAFTIDPLPERHSPW